MDLAKEQKRNYGDDITSTLRQARKRRFELREEQRIAQDIELQSYLNQLIIEDAERSLATLNEQEVEKDTNGKAEDETASSESARKKEEVEEKRDTCMSRLNDLFAKVDERRKVSALSNPTGTLSLDIDINNDTSCMIFMATSNRKGRCLTICAERLVLRFCKSL